MSIFDLLGCNCLTKKDTDTNVILDIVSIDIVEGKPERPEDIKIKIEIGFNIPRPGVQRGDSIYLKLIENSNGSLNQMIDEIDETLW